MNYQSFLSGKKLKEPMNIAFSSTTVTCMFDAMLHDMCKKEFTCGTLFVWYSLTQYFLRSFIFFV